MKVLIIEDEIYNFEDLKDMLIQLYPQIHVYGPVTNIIDLEQTLHKEKAFDIIFADIRLEDGLCFSVFEKTEVKTPIIFTTAYDEFALNAFKANGIAYLLKPIMKNELEKATHKALLLNRGEQDLRGMLTSLGFSIPAPYLHHIKAKTFDGIYVINVAQVNHFTLVGDHVFAMMMDGNKHRIPYSLDILMDKLDPNMFFRANRQYIINREAISRIRNYDNRKTIVTLTSYQDVTILISKSTSSLLDKWIEL